jgi:hypothetical protein
MKISRRLMMIAPLALTAIGNMLGAVPAAAKVVVPMRVPVPLGLGEGQNSFNILTAELPDIVHSIRVAYNHDSGAGSNRLAMTVLRNAPGGDVSEYENLREVLLKSLDNYPTTKDGFDMNHGPAVAVMVNRHSNVIAMRTRRGAGNLVLVGQNTKFNIDDIPDRFGIAATDALEDNEIAIIYCGGNGLVDAPFLIQPLENGRVKAFIAPETKFALGNSRDYGIIMRVEA